MMVRTIRCHFLAILLRSETGFRGGLWYHYRVVDDKEDVRTSNEELGFFLSIISTSGQLKVRQIGPS